MEVRAPLKLARAQIDEIVTSKERWISDKLAISAENAKKIETFALDYGNSILYRGKFYPITASPENKAGFDGTQFYMPPNLHSDEIKHHCIQVYRTLSKQDLTEMVFRFAKIMALSPSAVKINGARTRWGSCSNKKSLNFSWRLIMASDDVIDYVVVHELAHIAEMNHSPRFWAIVARTLPDYKERQKSLKTLQRRLSGENWA